MNYNQNIRIAQVTESTLVVGVDIGSTTHFARAFSWRGIELGKVFKFSNTREGFVSFREWIELLQGRNGKKSVIVGAEPTGHYWFSLGAYLEDVEIPFVMVNPYHVKQSKELDDNSQTKNDRKDPKVIAKLVVDGRYSKPYVPKGVYADLRVATASRQRIINELTSVKNRICRWFSIYFPEYLEVFGSFEAESSVMILKKVPMPSDIIKLGVEGINKIWRDVKLRAVGIKRAKTLVEAAQKSIGCKEGLEAARMDMELLIMDYEYKKAQYNRIMEHIEELCRQIPESSQMLAIKGIGLISVSGFLAEVGDIRRFDSPKQIQKLAGLSLRENCKSSN